MQVYLDVVVLLNFLVDFLLLIGTNRLCGYSPGWGRAALAAVLGGVYAGLCLIGELRFLSNTLWRVVFLGLMGVVAFGIRISSLRRCFVFVLLSMALGGIALGLGSGSFFSLFASSAGLAVLCFLGFRDSIGKCTYVPVEVHTNKQCIRLTALQDTGNALVDPVTGRPVLVVCGRVAQKLTGLTSVQLASPVDTIAQGVLPGLRLIPYQSVGQPGSMLLAMRFSNVKIGGWQGSSLIAFAPHGVCSDGTYEALTGGVA